MSKKAKAATTLPLDSPHWWPREKTVAYSRAHGGENADVALTALVNADDLPVRIEWFDFQANPPTPHKRLLSAKDYVFGPYISSNFLIVQRRHPDVPPLPPRPYALSFWGPKLQQRWPTEAVESELKAEPEAQQRQKPGTKAIGNWPDLLTRELIRVAFEEPELIRDRDKLVRHLRRVLTAEIKGWDLSQNKAIHQTLNHLLNRITSLRRNSP